MEPKKIYFLLLYLRVFIVIIGMTFLYVRYLNSVEVIAPKTPLMIKAAIDGNIAMLKDLVKNGYDVNVKDDYGSNALSFATWNSQYDANKQAVDFLLRHQADVLSRDRAGLSPIHTLIKIDVLLQRMQMIGKLIKFGASLAQADDRGYTLLDKVVESSSIPGVEMMLDWWGKIIPFDVIEKSRYRAHQIFMGDIENILHKRQDTLVINTQWASTIKIDAYWSPDAVDKRTGLGDVHYATINGDRVLLKKMINKRVNLNRVSMDEYGMRPLHYAVLHRHPKTVTFLVENGANINGVDSGGNTPLHMIAWLSNHVIAKNIVDYLLANGANINAQNKDGNTLLHLLIYNNNKDMIQAIGQKYIFDTSIKNSDRESAADLANRLNRKSLLIGIKK